jgi:hypothetical protein
VTREKAARLEAASELWRAPWTLEALAVAAVAARAAVWVWVTLSEVPLAIRIAPAVREPDETSPR